MFEQKMNHSTKSKHSDNEKKNAYTNTLYQIARR